MLVVEQLGHTCPMHVEACNVLLPWQQTAKKLMKMVRILGVHYTFKSEADTLALLICNKYKSVSNLHWVASSSDLANLQEQY